MSTTAAKPRRTKDGGYVVQVGDLQVGDRMRFMGNTRAHWIPIVDIRETSKKSRTIHFKYGEMTETVDRLMRRSTLVARAPREGEES